MIDDKKSVVVAKTIELSYIIVTRSPIADLKAIKNVSEIEGFRVNCMRGLGARAILCVVRGATEPGCEAVREPRY